MFRNFNIGTRLTLLIILGVGLMLTVITIVDTSVIITSDTLNLREYTTPM